MDLLFVPLAHENGGRMGEAARKFLDRLVLRVGGTASERAWHRCYAEQRLACHEQENPGRDLRKTDSTEASILAPRLVS